MIEIKDLSIELGEFHLRDIDLTVNDGEYMVVLGPTGAGKTVLVECIVGIYQPRTGTIAVDGVEVTHLYSEERNIGYVPQDYALFPNMTVKKNIAYGPETRKWEKAEIDVRVQQMMESLGISHLHHRLPLNLSGGERQRTALGRALITQPRVLLLDEPLSALDENLRSELAAELVKIQRSVSGTFLHICHSFEEAADVADRIAIMHEGCIAQAGTIAEVMAQPASLFIAQFTRTRNFFACRATPAANGCSLKLKANVELSADARASGPVTAAVRPEDIQLLNGSAESPRDYANVFLATVRPKPTYTELHVDIADGLATVRPKPTYTELHVDIADGMRVVLYDKRAAKGAVPTGERLKLRIPPEAVRLFPNTDDAHENSIPPEMRFV